MRNLGTVSQCHSEVSAEEYLPLTDRYDRILRFAQNALECKLGIAKQSLDPASITQ